MAASRTACWVNLYCANYGEYRTADVNELSTQLYFSDTIFVLEM